MSKWPGTPVPGAAQAAKVAIECGILHHGAAIYGLLDPTRGNAIAYVGKAANVFRRYREHVDPTEPENQEKRLWLLDLLSKQFVPGLTILEAGTDAYDRETAWIRRITALGGAWLNRPYGPAPEVCPLPEAAVGQLVLPDRCVQLAQQLTGMLHQAREVERKAEQRWALCNQREAETRKLVKLPEVVKRLKGDLQLARAEIRRLESDHSTLRQKFETAQRALEAQNLTFRPPPASANGTGASNQRNRNARALGVWPFNRVPDEMNDPVRKIRP